LEAKKLRLGGRIEKGKSYDFEHALKLVLEFITNPLLMWKTGDLAQQRLVLRLVFADALSYSRETGFGTPRFSPPIALACIPELDKMELVDLVRRSWNTLEAAIRQIAAVLSDLPTVSDPCRSFPVRQATVE
jgi:hypothetical protein